MSYSAHRPGRYDSQGRIILHDDDPAADEPRYHEREFVPSTGATPADALATEPIAVTTATAVLEREPEGVDGLDLDEHDLDGDRDERPADERPGRSRVPRVRPERRPRTPGSTLRRLAILGGADGHVLDEVPTETPRFVQMFFVLLGTALVSALSMLFALMTGVQVSVWLAIPLALVWAGIVFNLDRFLTSTMTATRSIGKLIGLAIPRIILATLIGLVVAEPVVLQAFHNDIAREVATTNLAQAQDDQTSLDEGPEKIALDEATARLSDLQNQAATGVVSGTESGSASQAAAQSAVDGLTEKLAAQQQVIDDARALYQCELDGTGAGDVAGCTGVQGEGASSDAAQAQLQAAQATYDDLAAQLRDANAALATAETAAGEQASASEAQNRRAAEDQLPAAQATYDQALAAYDARASAVAEGNADASGLLSQISALNRLADREPAIWWAHLLIAALFFMIELLPVVVKVLTGYGEPSLYEKAAAIRREVHLDRVTTAGFADRAAILSGSSARA
ncbi:hypothetical protein GCM10022219_02290 [Microbacterium oryzae]|uniref:DUF4407 domain-containing protein n=1 Tax=Microbacterium oryzae TaxID=743009 RepID=A0A6I6E1H9_9MICO|nr:DUF4407 domain-containing protein [Microbacterium oryzae]QGU26410.1 DUF4407 domain-containing protein [Microbacterium oryzae]